MFTRGKALVRTEPAHGRLRSEHGIDLDRRAIRRERTTEVPREGPTPRRRMRGTRTVEGPVSRRPGNGDCRKGTAGADPQWPVHVCRTRLSETVIARAIAENGARRARSGAARSQNAGPVDHLPAAQPSRFVLEVLDRRLHLVGVPRWPVVVGGQPRYSDLAAGGDQPEDRTLRTVVVAQGQEPHRLADRWQLVFHSVSFLSTVAGVPTATEIRHLFANYRKSIPPCRPAKSPRHLHVPRTQL